MLKLLQFRKIGEWLIRVAIKGDLNEKEQKLALKGLETLGEAYLKKEIRVTKKF